MYTFSINFLRDFQSKWSPFSLILNLFDPSFSQNLRYNCVQFLFACWTRLPKIWWSSPSLPQDCTSIPISFSTNSILLVPSSFSAYHFQFHLVLFLYSQPECSVLYIIVLYCTSLLISFSTKSLLFLITSLSLLWPHFNCDITIYT